MPSRKKPSASRSSSTWTSPLIASTPLPGRGLGIVAQATIPPGTPLIHVPVSELLIPSCIPQDFVSRATREKLGLRNHALLAAWVVWGMGSGGVERWSGRQQQQQEQESSNSAYRKSGRKGQKDDAARGESGMRQQGLGPQREQEWVAKWMATWPTLKDFMVGMPICWGGKPRGLWKQKKKVNADGHDGLTKKRKRKTETETGLESERIEGKEEEGEEEEDDDEEEEEEADGTQNGSRTFAILPPDVGGVWATINSVTSPRATGYDSGQIRSKKKRSGRRISESKSIPDTDAVAEHDSLRDGLLSKQTRKFERDVHVVQRALGHIPSACQLSDANSAVYAAFLHAWLIINTRSFYYVAPGDKPPADSEEAMALAPHIDVFNHTAAAENEGGAKVCNVSYGQDGFHVISPARPGKKGEILQGEEVLVDYGPHGETTLWVDYGFLFGRDGRKNRWDAIPFADEIVLAGLGREARQLLSEKGYLGEYTLTEDGVCWRTELVAWLGLIGQEEWEGLVDGSWSPPSDEEDGRPRKVHKRSKKDPLTLRQKMMRRVCEWILEVKEEAQNSITGLLDLTSAEVEEIFGFRIVSGTDGMALAADSQPSQLASQRLAITLQRWRQTWETTMAALQSAEQECPGSFVPSKPWMTSEDLKKEWVDAFQSAKSI